MNNSRLRLIRKEPSKTCASAHPQHGADVSHRGGRPGFVQVLDARTLRIPDYRGNNLFNTLGNFTSYPQAGRAFIDFAQSRVLQISGRSRILWDVQDPEENTGSTGRCWLLEVSEWRETVMAVRLQWEFVEYSPCV